MNIKDLKSFEAVYERKSINQAAKQLYITPQGLGSNIRALERELGTVLFERDKQGVTPTESAHLLYKRAELLIEEFEQIKNEVEQLSHREDVLRIGCACGVFNVIPFQLIQDFTRKNAPVKVEWCEYSNSEVKAMIDASEIEYGFIVGGWDSEDNVVRKLAENDVHLLAYEGHPLYGQKKVSIDMLKNEPLITLNEHFNLYHDFRKACQVRGFEPRIIAKTADANFQHKLCRQKYGLAVVTAFSMEDIQMNGIRAIPFEENLKWEVYGVYRKAIQSYRLIKQFEEFLKKSI